MSKWDLRKTGAIEAAAEWLRKDANAITVVIVRRDDAVMAVHPDCAPRDAKELVVERIDQLLDQVAWNRAQKRKTGRLELGEIRE